LSGTPRAGSALTAAIAGFGGQSPSYTREWLRCDAAGANCAVITGENGASYTLGPADVGATLRQRVTATDARGRTPVTSQPSAQVQQIAPPGPGSTAIRGIAREGEDLTADFAGFAGREGGVDFQWQRCGSGNCPNLPGAVTATYRVEAADVGKTLRV